MDFFCRHRDRPGSLPLRERLPEERRSYLDRFELVARGPAFSEGVLTGSVHVVDVPDAADARAVTSSSGSRRESRWTSCRGVRKS